MSTTTSHYLLVNFTCNIHSIEYNDYFRLLIREKVNMFALVLWLKTHETSVVDIKFVKITKKGVHAKWGKDWYPARVLKKSEEKDWLDSLTVSVDGEVLTAEKRKTIPDKLIMKRRDCKKQEKIEKALKKQAAAEENESLLHTPPIYDNNDGEDDSDGDSKDDETKDDNGTVGEVSCNEDSDNNFLRVLNESSEEETDSELLSQTPKLLDTKKSSGSNLTDLKEKNEKKPCLCSKFPLVTESDLEKLKKIMVLAKEINFVQNNKNVSMATASTSKSSDETPTKDENDKTKQVELIKHSGVWINEWNLSLFKNTHKKEPRELVRKLMRNILGEKILKISSATGGGGWKPIPTEVYDAVFEFVNSNAPKKKYGIDYKKYREVLTAMCATLRNPRSYQSNKKLKKLNTNSKSLNISSADPKTKENSDDEEKQVDKTQSKGNKMKNVENTEKREENLELNIQKENRRKKEEEQTLKKVHDKENRTNVDSTEKREEHFELKTQEKERQDEEKISNKTHNKEKNKDEVSKEKGQENIKPKMQGEKEDKEEQILDKAQLHKEKTLDEKSTEKREDTLEQERERMKKEFEKEYQEKLQNLEKNLKEKLLKEKENEPKRTNKRKAEAENKKNLAKKKK